MDDRAWERRHDTLDGSRNVRHNDPHQPVAGTGVPFEEPRPATRLHVIVMPLSPMDIAKRNRWSEKLAQRIASQCLRWTEDGAVLDIQRAAAIIRAGVGGIGCTCPTLDGVPVTGSSCPLHGLPSCEL